MKKNTIKIIKKCLKLKGGRSRPDKSYIYVLPLLSKLNGRILDVGCGRGSASMILKAEFGRRFLIDGVEAYKKYISRKMKKNYNKIFINNFVLNFKDYNNYDIYLFFDVIEHFKEEDTIKIIEFFKDKKIIASIPNAAKHWHQAEKFEEKNPYEKHLYNWTNEEILNLLNLKLVGEKDGIGVFTNIDFTNIKFEEINIKKNDKTNFNP